MTMGSYSNSYSSGKSLDQLTLSRLKPSYYVPKSITDLFSCLATIESVNERLTILNEYLEKYKEEYSRVQVFKRDLPQCTLHLLEGIGMIEQEIKRTMNIDDDNHNDIFKFEQNKALLDEFLAWKKRRVYNEYHEKNLMNLNSLPNDFINPSLDDHNDLNTNQATCKCKGNEKEIVEHNFSSSANSWKNHEAAEDNNNNNNNNNNKPLEDPFGSNATWKGSTRRIWTPKLHNLFVRAVKIIENTGEAISPKNIREVMCVKDLTNDQVKSHLQKYRLHVTKARADDHEINGRDRSSNPAAGAWYGVNNWDADRPMMNPGRSSSSSTSGNIHNMNWINGQYAPELYYTSYVPQIQPPPNQPTQIDATAAEINYEKDYFAAANGDRFF